MAHLSKRTILFMSLVALIASGAAVAAGSSRATLRPSQVLGEEVAAALSNQEWVRVIVAFSVPEAHRSSARQAHSRLRSWDAGASIRSDLLRGLTPAQFQLTHGYRAIPSFSGWVTHDAVVALTRDPRVRRIDVDSGGHGALAQVVPLVGLDTLQGMGIGGAGVTVALLDSGADLDHPDLADSIIGERCFCTLCCPNGQSTQEGAGSAEDDHGHGSNTAGIVTSNGVVAPIGGAPDANILLVKVLDLNNSFSAASDVIAGLDWIIAERPDVDIVNMSLGTSMLFAGDCDDAPQSFAMAFAVAIDTLRSLGVLTFAATQNDGSGTMISAPACVANALSVAASGDTDQALLASNSNAQTDLIAPGENVVSSGLFAGTRMLTGTSQSAAIASACAAVLLEAFPAASPDDVEQAMEASSTRITDPKNGLDFPRLDCAEAMVVLLPEPPGSLMAQATLLALYALGRRRSRARAYRRARSE